MREYAMKIQQRITRALDMQKRELSHTLVGNESNREFAVFIKSQTSPADKSYLVSLLPPLENSKDAGSASCTCLDSVPILCKHIHLAVHLSGRSYEAFGLHVGSRRVTSASAHCHAVDSPHSESEDDLGVMKETDSLESIPSDFETTVLSWSVGETCDKISKLPRHLQAFAADISTNVLKRIKHEASKPTGEAKLYTSLQAQSTVWKKAQRRRQSRASR